MKKYTAIVLAGLIVLFVSWTLIYEPYLQVQSGIARASVSGDYSESLELIREYRSSWPSYFMYNVLLLERFRLRLLYNEGVASGMLGDISAAEAAFRESAQSAEKRIAAPSLYNLALISIERGQLEVARSLLSKSLAIAPSDMEAKVNLELVIKRLGNEKIERPTAGEKERAVPSEQWRDMPAINGKSAPGSRRSYL